MNNLIDTAFSFPAIVFTVSTIFFLGFWIVTTLLGAGINSLDDFDFDLDGDTDIDLDADANLDSDSGSFLRGALEFLGLTGLPVLLALNLLSLFAWMAVMITITLLGGSDQLSGTSGTLVGASLLVGGFVFGGFVTGRIGRRLASIFRPGHALRRHELIGRICTVTTDKVTGDFGQGEVRDTQGAALLLQIRCADPNELRSGSQALIFDLDSERGVYTVSPDIDL